MNATALLKKQHRKAEGIFEKLEQQKGDARALVKELAVAKGDQSELPSSGETTTADQARMTVASSEDEAGIAMDRFESLAIH